MPIVGCEIFFVRNRTGGNCCLDVFRPELDFYDENAAALLSRVYSVLHGELLNLSDRLIISAHNFYVVVSFEFCSRRAIFF